jgi:hypothetical protein
MENIRTIYCGGTTSNCHTEHNLHAYPDNHKYQCSNPNLASIRHPNAVPNPTSPPYFPNTHTHTGKHPCTNKHNNTSHTNCHKRAHAYLLSYSASYAHSYSDPNSDTHPYSYPVSIFSIITVNITVGRLMQQHVHYFAIMPGWFLSLIPQ